MVQVLDDRGVVVEDLTGERLRTPGCRYLFYRENIFGGVGDSMKRAAVVSPVNFFFCRLSLFERECGGDPRVGVQFRPKFFTSLEVAFGKLDGRKLLGHYLFGQFSNGCVKNGFLQHSWAPIKTSLRVRGVLASYRARPVASNRGRERLRFLK